jgi:uncharacterized membrane protein YsdA (DUF1294 family)
MITVKTTITLVALGVLCVMNVLSFSLMGADKRRAAAGKWRISEKALFLAAALFGGLGGVLGMQIFRHKTQHWYFKWGFPALLIAQVILLCVGAYALYA